MKPVLPLIIFIITSFGGYSQKVDSIYFHLYTDSLKKGTHNYINVNGKLPDGKWKPLTAKEIIFTSSYGIFEGNELILPDTTSIEYVIVKAVLKSEPSKSKEITIWIKKKQDPETLPTKQQFFDEDKKSKQKSKNKSR